jgi:hypothetical protein
VVLGSLERAQQAVRPSSEWTTGKRLKEVDSALLGRHVRLLYDTLTGTEAQALEQLRTGHSRLRGFLTRIERRILTNVSVAKGRKTHDIFSSTANDTNTSGVT